MDAKQIQERLALARALGRLDRMRRQRCDELLAEIGVGHGQVPVLMELTKNGELTQRELTERLRVTPATVSGMLKRMERAGIVERRNSQADARVCVVSLTEAGKALSGRARDLFLQVDQEMTEGLSDEACARFREQTEKIAENLESKLNRKEG